VGSALSAHGLLLFFQHYSILKAGFIAFVFPGAMPSGDTREVSIAHLPDKIHRLSAHRRQTKHVVGYAEQSCRSDKSGRQHVNTARLRDKIRRRFFVK